MVSSVNLAYSFKYLSVPWLTHLVLLFRFDAVQQIEDELVGLKVLEFDENCIKLSLRTYMPTVGGSSYTERVEDSIDVRELNHELLIEVEGNMKLKNVQVSK